MSMIKTGIVNNKPDIKKVETEEELEKFAEKSDKERHKATNQFVESCKGDNDK